MAWGETSNDEMMVAVVMYMTDTLGVVQGTGSINPIISEVKVYPNPAQDQVFIELPDNIGKINFSLYDLMGREITREDVTEKSFAVQRNELPKGVYIYHIATPDGRRLSGKILFD